MDDKIIIDDRILSHVVTQYSDMIFRVSYQYVGNRQDAEDIVQEVFLALVQRLQDIYFNDEEHLKAWLIRVTINKSINVAKYNARRRTCEADNNLHTDDHIFGELDYELSKLSDSDRQIVYLHYYEGYSAKEISDFLGLRENTVHKRLSRAREKLKKFLLEED